MAKRKYIIRPELKKPVRYEFRNIPDDRTYESIVEMIEAQLGGRSLTREYDGKGGVLTCTVSVRLDDSKLSKLIRDKGLTVRLFEQE
jgi:hypothetical protein